MVGCKKFWMVSDGFGWFRVVSGGCGWFRVDADGFGWFAVLVVTTLEQEQEKGLFGIKDSNYGTRKYLL